MTAISSLHSSLSILRSGLTVAAAPLVVAPGDIPGDFSKELDDIKNGVVELAAGIARGQDKTKTFDMLEKLDKATDKMIEALTAWHNEKDQKVKNLENQIKLNQVIAELKTLNPTFGLPERGSSASEFNDTFDESIAKLQEIKKAIAEMKATLPGEIRTDLIGNLLQTLDEGLKNLNSNFNGRIQRLENEFALLQDDLNSIKIKLNELALLELKTQILAKKVDEFVKTVILSDKSVVTQALSQTYTFDLLDTVIDIANELKVKDQNLSNLCQKVIEELADAPAPDTVEREFTNAGDSKKTKLISRRSIELNNNFKEDAHSYSMRILLPLMISLDLAVILPSKRAKL